MGWLRNIFQIGGLSLLHAFLSARQQEVFFHIKNIKKAHPELAERLDRDESSEVLYFWYETEVVDKGELVRAIIKPELVRNRITDHFPDFVCKVEGMWKNHDTATPPVHPERSRYANDQR